MLNWYLILIFLIDITYHYSQKRNKMANYILLQYSVMVICLLIQNVLYSSSLVLCHLLIPNIGVFCNISIFPHLLHYIVHNVMWISRRCYSDTNEINYRHKSKCWYIPSPYLLNPAQDKILILKIMFQVLLNKGYNCQKT